MQNNKKIIIELGHSGARQVLLYAWLQHSPLALPQGWKRFLSRSSDVAMQIGAYVYERLLEYDKAYPQQGFSSGKGVENLQGWLKYFEKNKFKFYIAYEDKKESIRRIASLQEWNECLNKALVMRLIPIGTIKVQISNRTLYPEAEWDTPICKQRWWQSLQAKGKGWLKYYSKDTPLDSNATLIENNVTSNALLIWTEEPQDKRIIPPKAPTTPESPLAEAGIQVNCQNHQYRGENAIKIKFSLITTIRNVIADVVTKESGNGISGTEAWLMHQSWTKYTRLPQDKMLPEVLKEYSDITTPLTLWIGDALSVTIQQTNETMDLPADIPVAYLLQRMAAEPEWQLWVETEISGGERRGRILSWKENLGDFSSQYRTNQIDCYQVVAQPIVISRYGKEEPIQVTVPKWIRDRTPEAKILKWKDLPSYLCRCKPDQFPDNPEELRVFDDHYMELSDYISDTHPIHVEPTVAVELHLGSEETRLCFLPRNIPLKEFAEHLLPQEDSRNHKSRMRLRHPESEAGWLDETRSLQDQGVIHRAEKLPIPLEACATFQFSIHYPGDGRMIEMETDIFEITQQVSTVAEAAYHKLSGAEQTHADEARLHWMLYDPQAKRWLPQKNKLNEVIPGEPEIADDPGTARISTLLLELHEGRTITLERSQIGGRQQAGIELFLSRWHTADDLVEQVRHSSETQLPNTTFGMFLENDVLPLPSKEVVWKYIQQSNKVRMLSVIQVTLRRSDQEERAERILVLPDIPVVIWFEIWARRRIGSDWDKYRERFIIGTCPWQELENTQVTVKDLANRIGSYEFYYSADLSLQIQVADNEIKEVLDVPIYESWRNRLKIWTESETLPLTLPENAIEWRVQREKDRKWLALDQSCGQQGIEPDEVILLQPVTGAYVVDLSAGLMGRVLYLTFPTGLQFTVQKLVNAVFEHWPLPGTPADYRLIILDSYMLMRLGQRRPVLDFQDSLLQEGSYDGLIMLGLCKYYERRDPID